MESYRRSLIRLLLSCLETVFDVNIFFVFAAFTFGAFEGMTFWGNFCCKLSFSLLFHPWNAFICSTTFMTFSSNPLSFEYYILMASLFHGFNI